MLFAPGFSVLSGVKSACILTLLRSDGISPEVVEQFVFEFGFTPNGAAMAVSTKGRGAKAAVAASVEASTLGGLRKQACNLVRCPHAPAAAARAAT